MDFTYPNNSRDHARRKRHGFRRFCITVGFFLLLFLILLGCGPMLLSTARARETVLQWVNNALPAGELTIQDWSFSWIHEQSLSNLRYTDSERSLDVTIQEIRLSSLFRLLPVGKIKADISIDHPVAYLPLIPVPVSQAPETPTENVPNDTPAAEQPNFVLPAWDIAFNLTITEAEIHCPQLTQPFLQQGELKISLPSLQDPLQATVNALLLDIKTTANATLNAPVTIVEKGITPALLQQATVALDAPWIKFDLKSTASPTATLPDATLSFSINTGRAFALLRPLNLLPPDLNSVSGHLAASATLQAADAERLNLAATLTSTDLSCAYNGRSITCSPTLSAALSFDPKNLLTASVQTFTATLPGLTVQGAGTLTNGTFDAAFQSAPFWHTFSPFIGNYPLKRPLDATLHLRALNQLLEADLGLRCEEETLATANLKAEELNPQAQSFKMLKVNTHCVLAPFVSLFDALPESMHVAGDLHTNLAAIGSLQDLKANVVFTLQNADLQTTSWQIKEAALLEGRAALTLQDQHVTLSNIAITSPIATAQGQLQALLNENPTATVQLDGTLTPEVLFRKWRVWGKDETPFAVTGDLTYAISANKPNTTLTCNAKLVNDNLVLQPHEANAIPFPFTLDIHAEHDRDNVTLNTATFTTPWLNLETTGAFALQSQRLALKGQLTPDFDTLFTTLPALAKQRETFAVSGKHTRDFTFEAPLSQGAEGILNYGTAETTLHIDTVTIPGLDIPQGDLAFTLKDGVAAVDGTFDVNGGTVALQPRLNLSDKTFVLSWEKDALILDRVQLTQRLFDTALGAVNPMLASSANPSGFISLTCQALHLPLTGNPLQQLDSEFRLSTHSCKLKPNGTVQAVLAALAKKDEQLQLEDQAFTIKTADGILKTDPAKMRIEKLSLTCEGQTDLVNQTLDYTITIPLNESLLGRSLAKSVKPGQTVTLPISGPIQKPNLDTKPLTQVFADTAVNKAKAKISNKIEKALQKRTEKTRSKSNAPSPSSGDPLEDALLNLFGN